MGAPRVLTFHSAPDCYFWSMPVALPTKTDAQNASSQRRASGPLAIHFEHVLRWEGHRSRHNMCGYYKKARRKEPAQRVFSLRSKTPPEPYTCHSQVAPAQGQGAQRAPTLIRTCDLDMLFFEARRAARNTDFAACQLYTTYQWSRKTSVFRPMTPFLVVTASPLLLKDGHRFQLPDL